MENDASSLRHERAWFARWRPTLARELTLYAKVYDALHLRPADLGPDLEIAICRHILRDAIRSRSDAWARAPELLQSAQPLDSVLRALFGGEVPLPVAVAAIEIVTGATPGDSDAPDAVIARLIAKREEERRAVGGTEHIWLVTIKRGGSVAVSVSRGDSRQVLRKGLVAVVDERRQTSEGVGREDGG